ncbi:MAG TPA: gluconate 2-dehydrogenase subunit 3 family protein [Terriglobia bacterium]|nr:gluconate 2-dehydrogenase subunit 3 family protein [Terriglobia bacterium]
MSEQVIGRRQSLKYLGMLAGTAAGRDFLAAWLPSGTRLSAEAATPQAPYKPQFFKPDEFRTVEVLTELIIPSDATPGAKEAKVAQFIDFVVFSAAEFRPGMQQEWIDGLRRLDSLSRDKCARPFADATPQDQEALLTEISLPERTPGAEHPAFGFYKLMKGMTVDGFYSSRVGLIDVLGYKGLQVLSEFPGCTHPEHQT